MVRSHKDDKDTEATEEPSMQVLEDEDDVLDDDLNDNDAVAAKLREKQQEDRDYDGEEEEMEQVEQNNSGNYSQIPPVI